MPPDAGYRAGACRGETTARRRFPCDSPNAKILVRMGQSGGFRDEVVERLRASVDAREFSVYRVEKQLARGRGYVADALRGDKKLSVELICEVLEVIGVKPEDFFGQMMTPRASSEQPPVRRRGRRPKTAALPPPSRNLSTLIQAILVVLAERGVLSLDEVEEAERKLAR